MEYVLIMKVDVEYKDYESRPSIESLDICLFDNDEVVGIGAKTDRVNGSADEWKEIRDDN